MSISNSSENTGVSLPPVVFKNKSEYSFYEKSWADAANIDKILDNIGGLLAKGEASINKELADLASIDPGSLDQSRLLQSQVNLSRWQLASQLLSNFASSFTTGLKNTLQNVGR